MATEVIHPAIAAVAAAASGLDHDAPVARSPLTRQEQARTLQQIIEAHGPAGLLLAGRHLDVVEAEPILLVLLNSDRPDVLLEKIDRLNRFLHSTHRHRVHGLGANWADLEHWSTNGTRPSPIESLFVCGLYLELLSRIGCREVTCTFPNASSAAAVVYRSGLTVDVPIERTERWLIGWTEIEPARPLPGLDRLLLGDLPPDLTEWSVGDRVAAVIRSDLTRTWRLDAVASQLAVSPRTLQRKLRAEGRSFSETLCSVRVAAAQELLRDPARSITDIGYVTGFADTAHFSRTFMRETGLSPSRWRRRAG